jgi:hypothetical protein
MITLSSIVFMIVAAPVIYAIGNVLRRRSAMTPEEDALDLAETERKLDAIEQAAERGAERVRQP